MLADTSTLTGSANGNASVPIRTGLVGRDILSSRSPWLHECEAKAQGLKLTYELFDFSARSWSDEKLPPMLQEAAEQGFAGLNVTYPFKQAIVPFLDTLVGGAEKVGSVNTVAFRNGQMEGHNTDLAGFALAFTEGLGDVVTGCVLQLGAGGAGSATAYALLEAGVEQLLIADAAQDRANLVAEKLASAFGAGRVSVARALDGAAAKADGIVNATPVGMTKLPGLPLPAELVDPRHWVADIVYFPLETALLRHARSIGCITLDGSHMAINQAAMAFEIFTGFTANRPRMRESFDAFELANPVR